MDSDITRRKRRRKWIAMGIATPLLLIAALVVQEVREPGEPAIVQNPGVVLPTYLPEGFSLERITGGEPPGLDVKWLYLGEVGQADPFTRRDALVVSANRTAERLFREEGTPVPVLGQFGSFVADSRELGFPVTKLQFEIQHVWVVMMSKHLGVDELVALAEAMEYQSTPVLPKPHEGIDVISRDDFGPLGVDETGGVRFVSYERGDEFIRIVLSHDAKALTSQTWWGAEQVTIDKRGDDAVAGVARLKARHHHVRVAR